MVSLCECVSLELFAMASDPKPLIYTNEFCKLLGLFHLTWCAVDQIVDYAIHEFLNIMPEQIHLLTSGMMFKRKAQLLAGLIARSNHSKKQQILTSLNFLRGEAKRDVIAHSYVDSTPTTATFLHRTASGEFKAKKHSFSLEEFRAHVFKVVDAAKNLQAALAIAHAQLEKFEEAALRASHKDRIS